MKRLALLVTALLALGVAGVAPAHADADVEVTNDRGGSNADLRYQTRLTIRGDGFQVVRGGFGGVYVLFGWVSDPRGGSWRPSQGGLTGEDYQYIPDAEDAADNKGYLKFIAFPGSDTTEEAAAVLSDRGGFSVDLTIPGPVFESVDRGGQVSQVDCREVTCGVITIGAHGVKSAANETFTPISFGTVYDEQPAAPAEPTASASPTTPTEPADPAEPASPDAVPTDQAAPGEAALVVDRATAVSGHAMAFSAQGFAPGEQVAAVLDDGVAAVGPLVAGASGEVVGVLQLPLDLPVGTHELRLTGAVSGTAVTQRFPVSAGDDVLGGTDESAVSSDDDGDIAATTFALVAGCVFLLTLVAYVVALLRRRRPTPGAVA